MPEKIVKDEILVEGMSCAACEQRIENGLLPLAGVKITPKS